MMWFFPAGSDLSLQDRITRAAQMFICYSFGEKKVDRLRMVCTNKENKNMN